ncbi:MAG: HEAT repeat domain-containing protein [Anaerolineae bacterium]|nr:HEAT repeat domain-containing protein [Anaerolineae bacterium]
MKQKNRQDENFTQTLERLRDPGASLTAAAIRNLSNLSAAEIEQLAVAWPDYAVARRRQLARQLVDLSEADFNVNFEGVFAIALEDTDEEVRITAIEGMWENQSVAYMDHLLHMVNGDPAAEARAAAAIDLGRFILMGELEQFPLEAAKRAQAALAGTLERADEHRDVRRRALEAIANCGHPGVPGWIEEAYADPVVEVRASALFAMGRSYDLRWRPIVLDELESDEPPILYEAARAAGELELQDAVSALGDLLLSDDRELQEVAVWALGQIGGPEATDLLEAALETAPDDDFIESIEDALNEASLFSEDLRFDRLDF